MKHCSVCGELKSIEEFYRCRKSKDGHKPDCIACRKLNVQRYREQNRELVLKRARMRTRVRNRERELEQARLRRATPDGLRAQRTTRLRATYGVTLEDYEILLARQSGVCKICRKPPRARAGTPPRLHVDHDHVTGDIRGLLCGACNQAIGLFRDDRVRLLAAVAYLQRNGDSTLS